MNNEVSPVILDFLEDDSIFYAVEDNKRLKSKTEFVRRDRMESDESQHHDEISLTGDAQAYLSSIMPNNSIKFNKPSQSVSLRLTSC